MNKKILSLAIAAAVAAPMAAQADVSVNGALSMDMYSDSTSANSLDGSDEGTSKLEFNVKSGKAFAKYALALNKTIANGSSPGTREAFAGLQLGSGMSLEIARLANAYVGGVKVDTMTANFLESRRYAGGVSKVPSFENGMLGLYGKAGDVSWAVQYGLADPSNNRLAANVKFAAGPVDLGVGYYTDSLGNATSGISGKMKFGDIKVGASFESADSLWTATGNGNITAPVGQGTAENIAFVDVAMPLGNGTVGLGLGTNTTASTTFSRLSYQMKIDAATVTVGGRSSDGDTRVGAGLKVSF